MSRHLGPRLKIMRALGTDLPGLSRKKIEKRPYPPGQHGQARKKLSQYAVRLKEKQKVRMSYGVTERQLTNLMIEARKGPEAAGEKLVQLLERRLDNIVFRAGLARTIPEARQLVNHGHILVDGARVDIPSYRVSAGQVISVREKSRTLKVIQSAAAAQPEFETSWLDIDRPNLRATVKTLPDETAVLFPLQVQLVVEFYSQRI